MTIDAQTLAELRELQLRIISEWLASDEAKDAWLQRAAQISAALLDTRLDNLVDLAAIERAVEAATSDEFVDKTARPIARALLTEVAQRLSTRSDCAADLLGDASRAMLDEVALRPDIIDEALLRAVMQDSAMETVMRDVLYDALLEFDKRANPLFADWGLPALIDSLPLLGKGALKRAMLSMRDDFNKRLEPEIRRFLKVFARSSLERTAQLTIDKSADPEFASLRKHVLAAVLERPIGELSWSPDEERGALVIEALTLAVADVLRHEATRAELVGAARELLVERWGTHKLSEVLAELDVAPPDPRPAAAALWPLVRAAAASDPALEQMGELIDRAHEAWLRKS